ncbi:putative glycerophosphodiester phosphodiesterase [Helianthus annuus]|nr:putative glycerophosphodiester phosphodiesterase [Helianthus annuus]
MPKTRGLCLSEEQTISIVCFEKTKNWDDKKRLEAKKLAISGGLDKVVLEANGIFRNPASVREIKESNLSLLTYGKLNVPEAIHAQYLMGVIVDLVQEITSAVACFKNEDEGAEVKENTNKIEPSFFAEFVSQVMQH